MNKQKLTIIGIGHVGSYVLSDIMKLGLFSEIALIDSNENISKGEALDQLHANPFTFMPNTKVFSGTYQDCADSDLVIVSAGASIVPAEEEKMPDRALLAENSAKIIREIMANIVAHTNNAVLIFITNPVDTIVHIAENEFDYPAGKIFGTGTMLDTARLKRILADKYKIDPKSITAYMMGEHGMTAFPVLSRANIQGFKMSEWKDLFESTEIDQVSIKNQVVQAAYDVFNGKGWTNAGIAQAVTTLVKAVMLDERSIYPVSTTLRGQYGYNGNVTLSMPCIIGRNGIEKQLEIILGEEEEKMLCESAAYIQNIMSSVGAGIKSIS